MRTVRTLNRKLGDYVMFSDTEGVMAVKAKCTWKREFQFVNFGEMLSVMCPYCRLFLLLACVLAFIAFRIW
jgi:hypothetical protein